jgi:hypothetical protein
MKKLLSIFLLFALLIDISSKLAIVVGYEANKKFIEDKLCENKYRPKLQCHGKCHMMKELKKEEKRERKSSTGKEKHEIQFFSNNLNPDFKNYYSVIESFFYF